MQNEWWEHCLSRQTITSAHLNTTSNGLPTAFPCLLWNFHYDKAYSLQSHNRSTATLVSLKIACQTVKITEKRCHEIFDEVNDNIGDIKVYNP